MRHRTQFEAELERLVAQARALRDEADLAAQYAVGDKIEQGIQPLVNALAATRQYATGILVA